MQPSDIEMAMKQIISDCVVLIPRLSEIPKYEFVKKEEEIICIDLTSKDDTDSDCSIGSRVINFEIDYVDDDEDSGIVANENSDVNHSSAHSDNSSAVSLSASVLEDENKEKGKRRISRYMPDAEESKKRAMTISRTKKEIKDSGIGKSNLKVSRKPSKKTKNHTAHNYECLKSSQNNLKLKLKRTIPKELQVRNSFKKLKHSVDDQILELVQRLASTKRIMKPVIENTAPQVLKSVGLCQNVGNASANKKLPDLQCESTAVITKPDVIQYVGQAVKKKSDETSVKENKEPSVERTEDHSLLTISPEPAKLTQDIRVTEHPEEAVLVAPKLDVPLSKPPEPDTGTNKYYKQIDDLRSLEPANQVKEINKSINENVESRLSEPVCSPLQQNKYLINIDTSKPITQVIIQEQTNSELSDKALPQMSSKTGSISVIDISVLRTDQCNITLWLHQYKEGLLTAVSHELFNLPAEEKDKREFKMCLDKINENSKCLVEFCNQLQDILEWVYGKLERMLQCKKITFCHENICQLMKKKVLNSLHFVAQETLEDITRIKYEHRVSSIFYNLYYQKTWKEYKRAIPTTESAQLPGQQYQPYSAVDQQLSYSQRCPPPSPYYPLNSTNANYSNNITAPPNVTVIPTYQGNQLKVHNITQNLHSSMSWRPDYRRIQNPGHINAPSNVTWNQRLQSSSVWNAQMPLSSCSLPQMKKFNKNFIQDRASLCSAAFSPPIAEGPPITNIHEVQPESSNSNFSLNKYAEESIRKFQFCS